MNQKRKMTMRCHKFLAILLIIMFLIVFFSCSYLLLKDYFELKDNNDSNENLIEETIEVNEETQEKIIDWDYLKSVNEDIIVQWLGSQCRPWEKGKSSSYQPLLPRR